MRQVFVSYPPEDERIGSLITGQRLETEMMFTLEESAGDGEPGSHTWERSTAERIGSSDGILAVLTRQSENSASQRWELAEATAEDMPVLGIQVYGDEPVPEELEGSHVEEWTWDAIIDWIDTLGEPPPSSGL